MLAESRTEEEDTMVKVVVNLKNCNQKKILLKLVINLLSFR